MGPKSPVCSSSYREMPRRPPTPKRPLPAELFQPAEDRRRQLETEAQRLATAKQVAKQIQSASKRTGPPAPPTNTNPKIRILRVDIIKTADAAAEERRLDALWTDAREALRDYQTLAPPEEEGGRPQPPAAPWSVREVVEYLSGSVNQPFPKELRDFVRANPHLTRRGRCRVRYQGRTVRFQVPKNWT